MRKSEIMILIESKNEVNAINSANRAKLDHEVQKAEVCAQKIDTSFLNNYNIIITTFRFLTSLVINISLSKHLYKLKSA